MTLSPRLEQELSQLTDGDKLQAELESIHRKYLDKRYPEPEENEVLAIVERLRRDDADYHNQIEDAREVRYLHDVLPKKWQEKMQDGRRFYSRLSHNEILRVVAIQTRNPYKFRIPARGATKAARDRAQKQSRWANQFFPAMERKAGKALRRQVVDGQNGDGRSAWLVYLTDAYDELNLDRREDESDKDYLARTEEELISAPSPIGLRALHKLVFHLEEDGDGVSVGILREMKPTRATWNEVRARIGDDRYFAKGLPELGTQGFSPEHRPTEGPKDLVECVHYWDRRWHCYIVDGKVIDGPEEHKLPGVPIIPVDGIVTSSDERSEQYQGITWGMTSLELATNDLLTRELDTAFTYQRPRLAIQQKHVDGRIRGTQEKPFRLNFTDEGVPELLPGQEITNVFAGWEPYKVDKVLNALQSFWQRSGLNPISAGESPGADPAGYTVNTLMGASQNLYEVNLDNEARSAGMVMDYVRLLIRDVIKHPVYLSVPMADAQEGGTEWLGLSPDDIDETPVETSIDPLSDVNRLAVQASLRQGNKEGYVPKSEVQLKGYGADDPDLWDREMVIESALEDLKLTAIEEAKQIIYGRMENTPVLYGPNGEQIEQGSPQGSGGRPMPPNAPEVGKPMMDEQRTNASAMGSAGQDSGYTPPGEPTQ